MPSAPTTTSASTVAPLANVTRAMSPSCSKPMARWPRVDDAGGQVRGEEIDEVGAVHAEGRVPAGGVGHLHRRDRRAVVAEIVRVRADARAPFLHRRPEADALAGGARVRRDVDAGADLAERRRLLVDRDVAGRARAAHWRRTGRRCRRRQRSLWAAASAASYSNSLLQRDVRRFDHVAPTLDLLLHKVSAPGAASRRPRRRRDSSISRSPRGPSAPR